MTVGAGSIFKDIYTQEDISALKFSGLVSQSKDGNYIRPHPAAYDIMNSAGYNFTPAAKMLTNPVTRARRNISAQILYTFNAAGISVFNDELTAYVEEPFYSASFAARQKDKGNLFGSSRFHGIFCTPQEAFLVYCVDALGFYYKNEIGLFNSLIQITGIGKTAIIMMGASTEEIASHVLYPPKAKNSKEKNYFKPETFAKVFELTTLPVHFIPVGDAGAQILKFMISPGYREKTARAVLGSRYIPPYKDMPFTDAVHPAGENNPSIVAVDMDVHRIDRALEGAKEAGFKKIVLYALKEQISFLKRRYADNGSAEIFGINTSRIKNTIGFDTELRKPSAAAYTTEDGRCFNASDISAYRKTGKQDRAQTG